MRAILIDAEKKTVTETDYNGNYKHIYTLIGPGCDDFNIVTIEGDNCIFVDGEGLLKNPKYFFIYEGYPQPLAGNGVILGPEKWDDEIEDQRTTPCDLTIEFVTKKVTFTKLSVLGFETTEGKTMHYGMPFDFIRTEPVFGLPNEEEEDGK